MRDIREAVRFTSRMQWRNWLARNHATKSEALLIIYKRAPMNAKFSSRAAWNLLNENKMTTAGIAKLPRDALEIWEKHRPQSTIIVGMAQGRGIRFEDGKDYLSMIKLPARAP